MKKLAKLLLEAAEEMYLEMHGWRKVGKAGWLPPSNYIYESKIGQTHAQGHAINSQKKASHEESLEQYFSDYEGK